MSAEWKIVGQIGNVIKKKQNYMISIADNKYKINQNNEYEKESTIWFNCVSSFKPKVNSGDTVIAEGDFKPSKNPNFPFVLKVKHIGIIKKKE